MKRSGLFLIELIIVILFFTISAAVCMQIFAAAKLTADRARRLDTAVEAALNAAELYKSCGGNLSAAAETMGAELSGENASLDVGDGLILTMTDSTAANFAALCSDSSGGTAGAADADAAFCDIIVRGPDGETVFAITAAAFGG